MTQIPPARIPGASREPPQSRPGQEAWLLAIAGHRRRMRAERRRYADEVAALRERYGSLAPGPPCQGDAGELRTRWYQPSLDELDT